MTFDDAFDLLKLSEGGFQNDYHDNGNWTGGKIGSGKLLGTKYGISAASYPNEDIENLTPDRAKILYFRDFWDCFQFEYNGIPESVRFDLFDIAVQTSAPGRPNVARVLLQRALGVTDDGIIGPVTRSKLIAIDPERLDKRLSGEKLLFLTKLSPEKWQRYGKGWTIRIANNLKND